MQNALKEGYPSRKWFLYDRCSHDLVACPAGHVVSRKTFCGRVRVRERSPRACPSPSFPFPFFFFFCLREMEKGFLESEYERDSPGCLGVLVTLGKVSPRRTWSPAFPQVTPSFGRVYAFWVCFDLTAGFRDRAAGIDSSVVRGIENEKKSK